MNEPLFPSGPWVGFYNYFPGDRHRMDLDLVFKDGSLDGFGVDDVGQFTIKGSYDAASRECSWIKTYPGSHSVYYQGYREGKGIWGRWEIAHNCHGGFHIWPRTAGEADDMALEQEKSESESNAAPVELTQPAGKHTAH